MVGKHIVPSLEPGCPWYELSKIAPPNIKWCEASQCGWVTEPANTWSNIFYIVVAVLMFIHWNKEKVSGPMKWFPFSMVFVGVTSGIYHASYTFFFQIFDFAGMNLFLSLFFGLNLIRIGKVGVEKFYIFSTIVPIFLTLVVGIFYMIDFPIQLIVVVLVISLITTEGAIFFSKKSAETNYKYFFLGIIVIAVAATFSGLDITRTFCDPGNHIIQGHAIWHFFTSIGLYLIWKFYLQFGIKKEG